MKCFPRPLLHRVELLLSVEMGDQKLLGPFRISEDREAGLHVLLVVPLLVHNINEKGEIFNPALPLF